MTPDDFRRLAAAGLNTEQIAIVMEMFHERDEARKADQRARWRKSQENKKNALVSSRELTTANAPRAGATRVEDKPLPTEIEPPKPTPPQRDLAEFRAGLAPDVSEEVITEFVKVRRKKRGALTGFAARIFREDAAKCGMSVADAARECVRSSWITVKPEYFTNRQRAGPATPKPNPALDVIDSLMDRLDAVTPSPPQANPPYPRLVAPAGSR